MKDDPQLPSYEDLPSFIKEDFERKLKSKMLWAIVLYYLLETQAVILRTLMKIQKELKRRLEENP